MASQFLTSEVSLAKAGWAILELMGHRRLAGYVTEEEIFGVKMCRIDVPGADDTVATQYYGGASIYCLTPCTEETARAVASEAQPEPVTQWDARRLLGPPSDGKDINDDDETYLVDSDDCPV